MTTYKEKACAYCGRSFTPKTAPARFCSDDCRALGRRSRSGTTYKERAWQRDAVLYRPFVAWDGEGIQDPTTDEPKLVLLQGSNGASLEDMSGLSTLRCLRFLTSQPSAHQSGNGAHVNNIWFANGYDVNMILGDLPRVKIQELYEHGRTWFDVFYIRYRDRYEFLVKNMETGRTFDSCDSWGFFQSPFETMLDDWNIETGREIIAEGKAERSDFHKWNLTQLKRYNEAELITLVEANEKLRSAVIDSGWSLNRWYGPSALATWFLNQHKVKEHITQPNEDIQNAALTAYFGGRIDACGWGTAENVYHYDIINAYVHGITKCPSLQGVTWEDKRTDDPFALVHIKWDAGPRFHWYPFPWRCPDPSHRGQILYPRRGEGWYWNVEVQAAQDEYGDNLRITPIEWRTPTHNGFYPLDEPLHDAFQYRYKLKREGNPAHKPVKLGYLAISGKFSQSRSYNRRRPVHQCHVWGGYLMAVTRANLMRASEGTLPYMCMTDGVYTKYPMNEKYIGDQLGEWEDQGAADFQVIAAGVYRHGEDFRCKGYLRESMPPLEEIIYRFEQGEESVPVRTRQFITMGAALMGGMRWNNWRKFLTDDRQIYNPHYRGGSKRRGEWEVLPRVAGYGLEEMGIEETLQPGWHYTTPRGISPLWIGGGMSKPYEPKGVVYAGIEYLEELQRKLSEGGEG